MPAPEQQGHHLCWLYALEQIGHGTHHLCEPNLVCSTDFSGSAQANNVPSLATITYCRPSSAYVIGEFPTYPMAECQRVAPSLVRRAMTLRTESPVKIRPESVVRTPAAAPPPPRSWFQRIFPV
jgi:hypothetical protein